MITVDDIEKRLTIDYIKFGDLYEIGDSFDRRDVHIKYKEYDNFFAVEICEVTLDFNNIWVNDREEDFEDSSFSQAEELFSEKDNIRYNLIVDSREFVKKEFSETWKEKDSFRFSSNSNYELIVNKKTGEAKILEINHYDCKETIVENFSNEEDARYYMSHFDCKKENCKYCHENGIRNVYADDEKEED